MYTFNEYILSVTTNQKYIGNYGVQINHQYEIFLVVNN